MKNLLYFLKKYGNKSFDEIKFNEIDALLLSQLSYLFFERTVPNAYASYNLKNVMIEKNAQNLCYEAMNYRNNLKLVKLFKDTSRYDNIIFSDISCNFDVIKKQQFYAMTFWLDDFLFISFRGTDLTMVGWREDFNMWFSDETPCQNDALAYTEKIFQKYNKKMILGGHSKGGNLAFYAGLYSRKEVINSIIKIYSFDGPGLKDKEPFYSDEYKRIKNKCLTFSSSSSIVAILLYHVDNVIFLKSRSFSILQHSAYNWLIKDEKTLCRIKNNKILSRFLDRALTKYLLMSTNRERKRFVDLLFKIVEDNPEATLLDIKYHPFRYLKNLWRRKKLLTYAQNKFLKLEFKKMRLCFKDVYDARKIEKKKKKAKRLLLSKNN